MTSKLVVAVLAHDSRPRLAEMVENIRHFATPEEIVVFNGGRDPQLVRGLRVGVCPYSEPLRYGNLVPFHVGVIRWLHERSCDYDFLITMDSDMLFVRTGVTEFAEHTMADSELMGVGYLRSNPWVEARMIRLRRFNAGWRRWWQPLFGTEQASWAMNPGLVFRRGFGEKALRFANLAKLLRLGRRSRVFGVEEFIYPTLADAMGCDPLRYPGESGVSTVHTVEPGDLRRYLDTESVFFLHKVAMQEDDPVRLAVNELRLGRAPELPEAPRHDVQPQDTHPLEPTVGLSQRLKDLYFRFLP
ncbi:MAG TPA: hypothetical protein VMR97_08925 [Acidimicrobiales bacterium]|nr:hypothetical protein [Acidimicrobiales bacterium]